MQAAGDAGTTADTGQPDTMMQAPPIDAGSDTGAATPFPDPDWLIGTPESQSLDPMMLSEADSIAAANTSYCLLVIRHGVLVWEKYFNGHDASSTDRSWSIAKSYSSAARGSRSIAATSAA